MVKRYKNMCGIGVKKFNKIRRPKRKLDEQIEDGINEYNMGNESVQKAIEREQPINEITDILEPLSTGKKGDPNKGKATAEELKEIKKRGEKEGDKGLGAF